MSATDPVAGGCLCGAVRFVASGDPTFALNCHCRVCQRITGSAYTPVAAYPTARVSVTGVIKYYERRGDSGRKVWEGFCPECGSRLTGRAETMPGLLLVQAGAYDDPTLFRPTMNIFTRDIPHWDILDPALPKHPGMPDL
jgi:hypothetical protein